MAVESPRPASFRVEEPSVQSAVKLRLRRDPEEAPEVSRERRRLGAAVLRGFSFDPEGDAQKAQELLIRAKAAKDEEAEAYALLALADAQAAEEEGPYAQGPEAAQRLAAEVLRRFEEAGDVEGRAAGHHVSAKALLAAGRAAEALRAAQEALQLYRALEDVEGEAATLDVLAQAQLKEEPSAAYASASSGRQIFRKLGDRRALMLERTAVGARLACGELEEALAEAEALLRRCRVDRGDRRDEASALLVLAEVHNHRDNWGEVSRHALAASELFGERRNEAAALHLAATAELARGGEALSWARRAQEIFKSLRERQREVLSRGLVVESLLQLQLQEEALELAGKDLEDFRQRQDHFSYSEGSRQRSSALLALGRVEEAREAARQACNAAQRLKGRRGLESQATALELLAESCRRSSDAEAMAQAAEELVACYKELRLPMKQARALRLCTRGHLILRRPKRAIEAAGPAMTLFKELGDQASADEMRSLFVRAQKLREAMRGAAMEARQAWLLYREHGDARLLFQAAKQCHDAHHQFDDANVLLLQQL